MHFSLYVQSRSNWSTSLWQCRMTMPCSSIDDRLSFSPVIRCPYYIQYICDVRQADAHAFSTDLPCTSIILVIRSLTVCGCLSRPSIHAKHIFACLQARVPQSLARAVCRHGVAQKLLRHRWGSPAKSMIKYWQLHDEAHYFIKDRQN